MAKKPAEVEATRMYLVFFDAQTDKLKCVVGDTPEDIALKIADLQADCSYVVIKGVVVQSAPCASVSIVSLGGVDYKVTKDANGAAVEIAPPVEPESD